jgi:hypothetical protein
MRHFPLKDGNSYGCNINCNGNRVLLQLNDSICGYQVRVMLTAEEVNEIIEALKENVKFIYEKTY